MIKRTPQLTENNANHEKVGADDLFFISDNEDSTLFKKIFTASQNAKLTRGHSNLNTF
jgi:hypothetical protein